MRELNWRLAPFAIAMGMAVYTAVIASLFVPVTEAAWLILTTFFVSHTTRGTPLRQIINYFLIITSALIVVSLLHWLDYPLVTNIVLCGLVVVSSLVAFLNRPLSKKAFFHIMLFSLVALIAGFAPTNEVTLSEQITGVTLGALLGLFASYLFFPIKLQALFCQGVVPVLKALHAFTIALEEKNNLDAERTQIEKALLFQQYPEWVYEVGFNPGLRASWRFVLVNIERVTEICFSLDYLISQGVEYRSLLSAHSALQKNAELIDVLIHYFSKNELKKTDSDYTSDLELLESELQKIVPRNIEAIDLAPEFLILTALVRDIRDMRGILLQLAQCLPT